MRNLILTIFASLFASAAIAQIPEQQDSLVQQKSLFDTLRSKDEKIVPKAEYVKPPEPKKKEVPKAEPVKPMEPATETPKAKDEVPKVEPIKRMEPVPEPPPEPVKPKIKEPVKELPAKAKSTPPAEERAKVQPLEPLELQTPADAVALAAADIKTLPPAVQPYIRYLSFQNVQSKSQRAHDARVNGGHLNHLHRQVDILIGQVVAGGWLLRINLADYNWPVSLWEQLGDVDPFWHVQAEVTTTWIKDSPWEGGIWPQDGKFYAAGAFKYEKPVKKVQTALAPWLSETPAQQGHLAALILYSQSKTPIVSADWFFNTTAIEEGRGKVGYYSFLGIKNQKDFERIIGFDKKLAQEFGNELRASVAISTVTLEPRALLRQATLGGAYWASFDFKLARDKTNPLRVLGKDIEKEHDASETYGHLPNGFFATGIFNREGKATASAPPEIASDHTSKSNDKRVHVNLCLRCHGTNGGLQPIDDWARNLYLPPLALTAADLQTANDLRRQYVRKLEGFLDKDKAVFADAVKEATSWSVKEYAKAYGDYFERYEDVRAGAAWVASRLGVSETTFKKVLLLRIKQGLPVDPVLASFVLEGARERQLSVRQAEEIIPLAYAALKGIAP